MLVEALGFGVLAPLAIAALVAWRAGERGWLVPLALGAGYLVAHVGVAGMPPLPPVAAEHWLPVLAVLGAGIGAVDTAVKAPEWVRWLVRLVAATLAAIALGAGGSVALALQTVGLLVVVWTAFDLLPEDRFSVVAIGAAAAAGAGALVLSHTALVGQLQGAVAALVGALIVSGWRRAAAPLVALLIASQWIIGLRFADMSFVVGCMLFGVPVLAAGVRIVTRKAPAFVWVPLMLGGTVMLASSAVMSAVVDYYAEELDGSPPVGAYGYQPGEPADDDDGYQPGEPADDDYGYDE